MDADSTIPLPPDEHYSKEVFSYGEQTILKMQDQLFTIDDYGTRVGDQMETTTAPAVVVASEAEPLADPLVRIERKLDAALRSLEALQKRIDSLDATVAHLVMRR